MWTPCAREAVCIGAPHAVLVAVALHSLLKTHTPPLGSATSGLLAAAPVSYGSVVDPVHTVHTEAEVNLARPGFQGRSGAGFDAFFCVVAAAMPWLTAMALMAWSRFGGDHVQFSCSDTDHLICGGGGALWDDILCVWASRALITLAWCAMACLRRTKALLAHSQQGVLLENMAIALTAIGLGADLWLCRKSSSGSYHAPRHLQ